MFEWYIFFAALGVAFFVGVLVGIIFSGIFDLRVAISKKKDYEANIATLNGLIAQLEDELAVKNTAKGVDPSDLFPGGMSFDYGLPRKLD